MHEKIHIDHPTASDPFTQGLPQRAVLLLLDPRSDRRSEAWKAAYRLYLRTDHWQTVKGQTLTISRRACQLCDSPLGLQVHHRPEGYRHLFREIPGIHTTALCGGCHSRHHRKGGAP